MKNESAEQICEKYATEWKNPQFIIEPGIFLL